MKLVLVLSVLCAIVIELCKAEVGTPCTSTDQCGADECCQIVNIIVASKRRQLGAIVGPNTSGTCEKYKQEGEFCNSFDVMNGYCSCAEGLTCKTVPVSTTALPVLEAPRKIAPGYVSYCSAN